jgi:hypothetical protein
MTPSPYIIAQQRERKEFLRTPYRHIKVIRDSIQAESSLSRAPCGRPSVPVLDRMERCAAFARFVRPYCRICPSFSTPLSPFSVARPRVFLHCIRDDCPDPTTASCLLNTATASSLPPTAQPPDVVTFPPLCAGGWVPFVEPEMRSQGAG